MTDTTPEKVVLLLFRCLFNQTLFGLMPFGMTEMRQALQCVT